MTGHRVPAVGLAVAALLVVAVVPAAAHINHVEADAQITDDGTVVVETAFAATRAWLAVRADAGGEPGRPLGWTRIDAEFRQGVAVRIRNESWGGGTVWVALHRDDGDGEFDPAEDEEMAAFGDPARDRIAVERGAAALVVAQGFSPQTSEHPNATVAEVRLPADGAVVLRNATGEGPGEVVGSRALSAGTHRNVTVDLDRAFYERRPASFALWAALRTDEGLVTAGGEPVASRFDLARRHAPDRTPTEAVVVTAAATPTATATEPATRSATPSPTATGATGPGFGVAAAVAGLVGAALLARLNRG